MSENNSSLGKATKKLIGIFIFGAWVFMASSSIIQNQMNETLDGKPLKTLMSNQRCVQSDFGLRANGIHLVMIATPSAISAIGEFHFQRDIFSFYCKLHGYHSHIIDPNTIAKKFGSLHDGGQGNAVICTKPVVMLYTFRDIFTKFGCDAKWILFFDYDALIVDFKRTIQSILSYSNHYVAGDSRGCDFIAQDAPTTINTGLLAFRVSRFSEFLLRQWVEEQARFTDLKVFWQEDQGWIQYLYLTYLEQHFKIKPVLNCADIQLQQLPSASIANRAVTNAVRLGETAKRSLCYALTLSHYGLRAGNRSTGKFCLLPGLNTQDRINLKDWPGEPHWLPEQGRLGFVMHLPEHVKPLGPPRVSALPASANPNMGSCLLGGLFLYHGKKRSIIEPLRAYFRGILGNTSSSSPSLSSSLLSLHQQENLNRIITLGSLPIKSVITSAQREDAAAVTTGAQTNTTHDVAMAGQGTKSLRGECSREILAPFLHAASSIHGLPVEWQHALRQATGSRAAHDGGHPTARTAVQVSRSAPGRAHYKHAQPS